MSSFMPSTSHCTWLQVSPEQMGFCVSCSLLSLLNKSLIEMTIYTLP